MKLKSSPDHEMIKGIRDIQMDIDDKNKPVIMKMLRSQIYSNPIESFVRELISNALDAHARAGKQFDPIDIWIPNESNPNFIVRDYGASMTPDIIANVYSKMGSSDKRDSNTELGAFGIGAASPLAYLSNTDTCIFYIETRTQEGDSLMYRKWAQYVDSTQMGMISLLEEHKLEPGVTGTQVTVPVTDRDDAYNRVRTAATIYTQYLKVRPKIVNDTLTYLDHKPKYAGDTWSWYLDTGYESVRPMAIVGGVPYPVSVDILNQIQQTGSNILPVKVVQVILKQKIELQFQVGELDLGANREHLQYTSKTIFALLNRFKEVLVDVGTIVSRKVYPAPNYFQACVAWHTYNHPVKVLLSEAGYKWKGKNLDNGYSLSTPNAVVKSYAYRDKSYDDNTQVVRAKTEAFVQMQLGSTGRAAVYVNDLGMSRISTSYIKYILDSRELEYVYVICPEDPKDYIISEVDQETLGIESLVAIKDAAPKTERKERVMGFVEGYYLPSKSIYRNRAIGATAWFETGKYAVNQGGVYVVFEENSEVAIDPTSNYPFARATDQQILRDVAKLLGLDPLYGFKRSVIHRLEDDWIPLADVIEDKLTQLEAKIDIQHLVNLHHETPLLSLTKFGHSIPLLLTRRFQCSLNPESILYKYLTLSEEETNHRDRCVNTIYPLLLMSRRLLHPQPTNITRYYNEVMSRYQILAALTANVVRPYRGKEDLLEAGFIHYVNTIDSQIDSKKETTIQLPSIWMDLVRMLTKSKEE